MSEFRYCPSCGSQNPKDAEECIKCGVIFSKFKPLKISIEKEKRKGSFSYTFIFSAILFIFILYISSMIYIQKKFLYFEDQKDSIFSLSLRLESIYKKIPNMNALQKEKFIKEIEFMEKLVSTFPAFEDAEKLNIFEENLKEIKDVLIYPEKLNSKKEKIEKRFKMLKK